ILLIQLLTIIRINKDVAQHIINLISKADKFSWIYHKLNITKKSSAFVYYCNCREELKNKKPRIAEISNQRDTLPRIIRYSCGGTIQINKHLSLSSSTTGSDGSFFSKQQLDGFLYLTRHQVYYWFKKFATKEYRLANDQLESARRYLENKSSFKLLYQDQHSLAFITPLLFILP
ncbi:8333_t:CDS:2, partial [Racocetra persica]